MFATVQFLLSVSGDPKSIQGFSTGMLEVIGTNAERIAADNNVELHDLGDELSDSADDVYTVDDNTDLVG